MTAFAQAQKPLFLTTCPTCGGTTRLPENPADPGDGWTTDCPDCTPKDLLAGRAYDPERAEVPF